jgi:hypothetical protein
MGRSRHPVLIGHTGRIGHLCIETPLPLKIGHVGYVGPSQKNEYGLLMGSSIRKNEYGSFLYYSIRIDNVVRILYDLDTY